MGCRRHDYREGRIRVDLSGSIVAARTAGIGAELPTMRPPRQYERIDYPLLCGEKQATRVRLAGTATALCLSVLVPLHWRKRCPPRKPCDDERDPPQRLRHELRRPYSTWDVDASPRPLDRVQHDRILAGLGAAGGTRQVRWNLLG